MRIQSASLEFQPGRDFELETSRPRRTGLSFCEANMTEQELSLSTVHKSENTCVAYTQNRSV